MNEDAQEVLDEVSDEENNDESDDEKLSYAERMNNRYGEDGSEPDWQERFYRAVRR